MAGNVIDFSSIVAPKDGAPVRYAAPVERPTMPKPVVEFWDQRIRLSLQARVSSYDKKWRDNYALVRNNSSGFRHGNLVAEFVRTLHLRLLAEDPQVTVRPDDPDYTTQAEGAEVVSQAVLRVAKLKTALEEASTAATWASCGWLEVGHPLDTWSNDIMRSQRAPGLLRPGGEGPPDAYEEVSPQELQAQGLDASQAEPFSPFEEVPIGAPEPLPLFDATFGYPWCAAVDPRLIITNLNANTRDQLDYICRLRFLTKKELQALTGVEVKTAGLHSDVRDIFEAVEGESALLFPDMICLAEVWIIRDRNNPEYNSWYCCYVYGEPDTVVQSGPNQAGGMVPLIPLKLTKLKKLFDTTLAEELVKYADLFDVGIRSMFRTLRRQLNKKWTAPKSAGLDPEDEKNLKNDNWTGILKAADPNSIKELMEEKFDAQLFQSLTWVKALAQSQSGASDIDRGQAIKDITARQTQALLEATGINVEGMKETVQEAATEAVMKLMHLVGLFNHVGRARKYSYGHRMVSMDRGTHDFTSSYLYNVEVRDSKTIVSNEERLVWTQLLKTLFVDTGGVLLPYLDREYVAKATVRKFGEGPEMLASRAAGRPASGQPAFDPSQLDPAVLQNLLGAGGAAPGVGIQDAVMGQHPERALGSQGAAPGGLGNALAGALRTGTSR